MFAGKQAAVFGLGRSGIGALKLLHARGATLYAWDDTEAVRRNMKVEGVTLAPPKDIPWNKLDWLVLSPGVPLTHPAPHEVVTLAKANKVPIVCDIELLTLALSKATYIGITGTNGKSTTTALIGHLCKACGFNVAVGGNIGIAASELVDLDAKIYVLELSSYQLELLQKTRFHIAVMLNLSKDHMERHGSMEGYIAAKTHVFDRQGHDDLAVIGTDDAFSRKLYEKISAAAQGEVMAISNTHTVERGVYALEGFLDDEMDAQGKRYALPEIRTLPGKHNRQNIAAAYAALRHLGVEGNKILAAMKTYPGLPHRMEWLGEKQGVAFVNDSKATNADAAANALACYKNIYWIAGGREKEGGIASLAPYFPRINKAFLIGEAQENFSRALEGKVLYETCTTLEKAVTAAFNAARGNGGGVVLLSPACASFDQFKNFEERGDVFRKLFSAL